MLRVLISISFIIGMTITIMAMEPVEVDQDGDSYFLRIYAGDKETTELRPHLDRKARYLCPHGYTIIAEVLGPVVPKNRVMNYYSWEIQCNEAK